MNCHIKIQIFRRMFGNFSHLGPSLKANYLSLEKYLNGKKANIIWKMSMWYFLWLSLWPLVSLIVSTQGDNIPYN